MSDGSGRSGASVQQQSLPPAGIVSPSQDKPASRGRKAARPESRISPRTTVTGNYRKPSASDVLVRLHAENKTLQSRLAELSSAFDIQCRWLGAQGDQWVMIMMTTVEIEIAARGQLMSLETAGRGALEQLKGTQHALLRKHESQVADLHQQIAALRRVPRLVEAATLTEPRLVEAKTMTDPRPVDTVATMTELTFLGIPAAGLHQTENPCSAAERVVQLVTGEEKDGPPVHISCEARPHSIPRLLKDAASTAHLRLPSRDVCVGTIERWPIWRTSSTQTEGWRRAELLDVAARHWMESLDRIVEMTRIAKQQVFLDDTAASRLPQRHDRAVLCVTRDQLAMASMPCHSWSTRPDHDRAALLCWSWSVTDTLDEMLSADDTLPGTYLNPSRQLAAASEALAAAQASLRRSALEHARLLQTVRRAAADALAAESVKDQLVQSLGPLTAAQQHDAAAFTELRQLLETVMPRRNIPTAGAAVPQSSRRSLQTLADGCSPVSREPSTSTTEHTALPLVVDQAPMETLTQCIQDLQRQLSEKFLTSGAIIEHSAASRLCAEHSRFLQQLSSSVAPGLFNAVNVLTVHLPSSDSRRRPESREDANCEGRLKTGPSSSTGRRPVPSGVVVSPLLLDSIQEVLRSVDVFRHWLSSSLQS